MDRRTALARLTEATRDVVPFTRRLAGLARRSVDEAADRLFGTDFEERTRWLEARYLDNGDPFGLDPQAAKRAAQLTALFHRLYFRTECEGTDNIPDGRALLVANHSGQVPIDAAIIACALFLDANPPRVTRAMVDRWAFTLPFVSTWFSRVGQVVGVPENARRLLEMNELLLIFPEGIKGVSKPFTRRYQLERFGLGFMRLALETGTPIVPVSVIGAEEQYINFGNLEWAAKKLGLPSFPLIPQLAVGAVPLPTKYRIRFGKPLRFDGDPDDEDANIEQKVWVVRQSIQQMLNQGLAERKSVFR